MSLRVLIAPDKFKGTLTAREVANAIAKGWSSARPEDRLELLPISDGGDGFGTVMSELLPVRPQQTRTTDAAHRSCVATWWWDAKSKTAIVESARVIGLAMLPKGAFHPFDLDTFGLGKVLQAAVQKGAHKIIVGIGGSATNDGGFGLARALGWRFLDREGKSIEHWTGLQTLAELRQPDKRWSAHVRVAVDVQNKLLGARGATRIYGPQKGIRPEDLEISERCLRRLAKVVQLSLREDVANLPGTGAAGGLGFGLAAFANARLLPGFALFARRTGLLRRIRASDLVITGEGAVDDSSLMGKGVGELGRACQAESRPCLALAGRITRTPSVEKLFLVGAGLSDFLPTKEALQGANRHLIRLAKQIAADWPKIPDLRQLKNRA